MFGKFLFQQQRLQGAREHHKNFGTLLYYWNINCMSVYLVFRVLNTLLSVWWLLNVHLQMSSVAEEELCSRRRWPWTACHWHRKRKEKQDYGYQLVQTVLRLNNCCSIHTKNMAAKIDSVRKCNHRGCTEATTLFNGDRPSEWEWAHFDLLQNQNHWTDCNKIWRDCLRLREDTFIQGSDISWAIYTVSQKTSQGLLAITLIHINQFL